MKLELCKPQLSDSKLGHHQPLLLAIYLCCGEELDLIIRNFSPGPMNQLEHGKHVFFGFLQKHWIVVVGISWEIFMG